MNEMDDVSDTTELPVAAVALVLVRDRICDADAGSGHCVLLNC